MMDLELRRVWVKSEDSSQRAVTEIQVEIVITRANIELGFSASPENDFAWAINEVVKKRERQTPSKFPGHLLASILDSAWGSRIWHANPSLRRCSRWRIFCPPQPNRPNTLTSIVF